MNIARGKHLQEMGVDCILNKDELIIKSNWV
jgi:hypothetical protein